MDGTLDELESRGKVHLVADMLAVGLHRFDAEAELIGNLPRAVSLPDELKNLKFTVTQELLRCLRNIY